MCNDAGLRAVRRQRVGSLLKGRGNFNRNIMSILQNPSTRTYHPKHEQGHQVLLGGHQSTHDGLKYAVLSARALGHNAMQVMLGGGQDYEPSEMSMEALDEFRRLSYGLATFVHLPYVINPCEGAPQRRGFYRATLRKYLAAAEQIGARALVMHPGYRKELTRKEAALNLLRFFEGDLTGGRTKILLETDAGSQNESAIGSLEFINTVIEKLDLEMFGICLDTAHLYARGVDLWDEATLKEVTDTYGTKVGLVHLNVPDLEVALGSNRDRHNSPFSSREWDHTHLIGTLAAHWPLILERRSLTCQQQDTEYIRSLLGEGGSDPVPV